MFVMVEYVSAYKMTDARILTQLHGTVDNPREPLTVGEPDRVIDAAYVPFSAPSWRAESVLRTECMNQLDSVRKGSEASKELLSLTWS